MAILPEHLTFLIAVRYVKPTFAGTLTSDGGWDDHWARMSLRGTWTTPQVRAIRRSLHDWLIAENLRLSVIDVTCYGDASPRFLVTVRPTTFEWSETPL